MRITATVMSLGLVAQALLCGCATGVKAPVAGGGAATADGLILLDGTLLAEAKGRAEKGDTEMVAAVARLRERAEGLLDAGPFTVTDKKTLPPSGDPHDYSSLAIYWWPNPDTPDGLPYVNRDGRRNPEADQWDGKKLHDMTGAAHTLALAWYFTGNAAYAERAGLLLRVWFLDPATRMNPNLNYAQGIPGKVHGTPTGIIESVGLATQVVDAACLLRGAPGWPEADEKGLVAWFREYLDWLENSGPGRMEGLTRNNHAVWYEAQRAAFALFAGEPEKARNSLAGPGREKIDRQIRADGSQPEELRRTKSFDYSCYNLRAFFALAALGKKCGADLWGHRGPEGQSIPGALAFLTPHLDPAKEWTHEQIYPIHPAESLRPFLRQAAVQFGDAEFRKLLESLPPDEPGGQDALLYPM